MLQNAGVLYILTYKCASHHSGVQFFDIWSSKVTRTRQFFHILTYKCTSRHSGVPFLNIGTSKSGPRVWCFPHFDLQMYFSPQRRAIFADRNFQNWSAIVVFCAFWVKIICFAPQRRAIFEHRNFKNWSEHAVFCTFCLANVLRATAGCHFWTSGTSKIAPIVRCFVHFDLQMRFAPQRRAIFEHRNFKNCSEHAVFCTFCLANVLRATAGCHFWTSELQKLLRLCGVLCILTWKCASRHSGVPFLNIGTSKIAPTVRCFVCAYWLVKCASRHSAVPFLNIGTSKIAPIVRCFVHFDLKMCFAPQRRAIFEHRNFKNCSDCALFCAFWLENVLRATAPCHFSSVC